MYEISKSLIGTERLAQAMAGSRMQEGTPFRAQRTQLARRMQRLQSRIDMQTTPFATRTGGDDSQANTHNMDWNWTNRFMISTDEDDEQPRTIIHSLSSDALMGPHLTNQTSTVSDAARSSNVGEGTSMHITAAGSLFSSNNSIFQQQMRLVSPSRHYPDGTIFHDSWQQHRQVRHVSPSRHDPDGTIFHDAWQRPRQVSPTRRNQPMTLHATTTHRNWRESPQRREQPQPPQLSTAHAYWREHGTTNSESNIPLRVFARAEEMRRHPSVFLSAGIRTRSFSEASAMGQVGGGGEGEREPIVDRQGAAIPSSAVWTGVENPPTHVLAAASSAVGGEGGEGEREPMVAND